MANKGLRIKLLAFLIALFTANAACLAPGKTDIVSPTQIAGVVETSRPNQAATLSQAVINRTASAIPTLRQRNTLLPNATQTLIATATATITPTPTITDTPSPTPIPICARAGCQAPELYLAGLDGNPITTSELRGRYVVLNFWATWCPPCRKEIPDLVKAYNQYKDQNVIFIGVAVDQSDTIKKVPYFVKQYKIPYPVATSLGMLTEIDYEINYLPTTFFIDPEGIIQSKVEQGLTYEEIDAYIQRLLSR
jgi:thiol-disulfide isomerase/thioredoxin